MDDKHYPGWVRRTAVSKRGLKGALVVVVEANAVGACFIDPATGQKTCD
jgi:hypothetical protein